ncbi:MAG: stage V sporulation protein AE [Oscillospiraceae bacterium]|nr:stage V sporulation protein AE [Oscillospiraceae bacterium]
MLLPYLKAFLAGGAICALGQLLIDKTNLTPAKILSAYVVTGVLLGGVGLYKPFAEWAGAGATVPLLGFGNTLAQGIRKGVAENGLLGVMTGGITAAAAGICAAVFFAGLMAMLFRPREKG